MDLKGFCMESLDLTYKLVDLKTRPPPPSQPPTFFTANIFVIFFFIDTWVSGQRVGKLTERQS